MKKYIIAATIVLLAASCSKQPLNTVINHPQPQNHSANVAISDLVNYFNNKFDCSAPKDASIPKDCFGQDFKVVTQGAVYSNPVYEFTDFTGDGAQDALVTIPFDGSGADREFYALTKDPGSAGTTSNGLKLNFYDASDGYPQKTSTGYTLTCPTQGTNLISCSEKIVWDFQKKQFVVTTMQMPVYSPKELSVNYDNKKYGFIFSLPDDWKGFTIGEAAWTESVVNSDGGEGGLVTGPQVYISNPKSTKQNPYEAIPVMVFTLEQWDQVQNGKLTSAAPFPPSEFDRNAKYVFALPPRFDYDFNTGYQEVENIVRSNPLKAY